MTNSKSKIYRVSEILKTKNIFRFSSDQSLSQVLTQLTSSHDAAFVFDKNDKFIGVVSSHFLFKSRSFNTNSKLKNIVKMPPKLGLDMSLREVAQAMIDSKIYFLPVVNGDFKGIVTINRLFDFIIKNQILNQGGRLIMSDRELITVKENITVSQALKILNREKIDKLPVVNDDDKLLGFVASFDLKDLVRDGDNERRNNRANERYSEFDNEIKKYMQRRVITINRIPSFNEAVGKMKQNKVGSLLIVDKDNRPISIVTKRDLLETIVASIK